MYCPQPGDDNYWVVAFYGQALGINTYGISSLDLTKDVTSQVKSYLASEVKSHCIMICPNSAGEKLRADLNATIQAIGQGVAKQKHPPSSFVLKLVNPQPGGLSEKLKQRIKKGFNQLAAGFMQSSISVQVDVTHW